MPSIERPVHDDALNTTDGQRLLAIARTSIAHGLKQGLALPVRETEESVALQAQGAAFVTLELAGQLRGCIGSLEPKRALAVDVSENAFAAAFQDPRFAPLSQAEFDALHLSVSVLGRAQPIPCASEAQLLSALRPGVDGLILEAGARRGTFLPSVWEQLPHAEDFLRHLKRKAGLAAQEWPTGLRALRYVTKSFSE